MKIHVEISNNPVEPLEFITLEKDRETRAIRRKVKAHKKLHKASMFKRKYGITLKRNGKLPYQCFTADESEDACHTKAKRLDKATMYDAFDFGIDYSMSFSEWLETEIGITWSEYDWLYSPYQQNDMFDEYEHECKIIW